MQVYQNAVKLNSRDIATWCYKRTKYGCQYLNPAIGLYSHPKCNCNSFHFEFLRLHAPLFGLVRSMILRGPAYVETAWPTNDQNQWKIYFIFHWFGNWYGMKFPRMLVPLETSCWLGGVELGSRWEIDIHRSICDWLVWYSEVLLDPWLRYWLIDSGGVPDNNVPMTPCLLGKMFLSITSINAVWKNRDPRRNLNPTHIELSARSVIKSLAYSKKGCTPV